MLGTVQNERPCMEDEEEEVENLEAEDKEDNLEDHGETKGNRR